MRKQLKAAWVALFETAVIAGGLAASITLGIGAVWVNDAGPLFGENPDRRASYVENSRIHAGDFAIVVRSLKRSSDCPIQSGIWIVDREGGLLTPIENFVSVAPRHLEYASSRIAYKVPRGVPPGRYGIRQYASCQRNPLEEVGQQLSDLPFEVLPDGVTP